MQSMETAGSVFWHSFVNAGPAVDTMIPENPSRRVLIFRATAVTCSLRPGWNATAPLFSVALAANAETIYTSALHGPLPGESWIVNVGGAGQFLWGEVIAAEPIQPSAYPSIESLVQRILQTQTETKDFSVRGPVEEYRARLEKRRREKLERLIREVGIPDCASLLLDTPVQFAIKQEMRGPQNGASAVGGGGGESGGDSLATATPGMVGD